MGTSVKVAVSLPAELHRAAERERKRRKQSRSQFFRSALEEVLRKERDLALDERYVRGYLEQPETLDEAASADELAAEAFADEPWE